MSPPLPRVCIGLLGSTLDKGHQLKRWSQWRPTVALGQHADLAFDRIELLHPPGDVALAQTVARDLAAVSPHTVVALHALALADPWDFEQTYEALYEWAEGYGFDPGAARYDVHITTGTHVAQICLFLLCEARVMPATLLQTAPPRRGELAHGSWRRIDLDLSRYDRIAQRHAARAADGLAFLKAGIATESPAYNALIAEIEQVAAVTRAPLLLTGPTGAGKTHLARRIFELKRQRNLVAGAFVEVNCATLRGDTAMSTLFGHTRGAFTGAASARAGLLRRAHEGVVFLDEIGELGADEQAMLLRAVEEKRFLPVGADAEVESDFQLIAGTNRDLYAEVAAGRFREDLLARIDLWHWHLPGLRDRLADLAPNLDFELRAFARREGRTVSFSREARAAFLAFGRGPEALWRGNFRDLNAAVTRMATLAPGGRIDLATVTAELARLRRSWGASGPATTEGEALLVQVLGDDGVAQLDRFDRVQLADVLQVCRHSPSLSAAGRALFAVSLAQRTSVNDADRLRKYLARFGLQWQALPWNRAPVAG